METKTEYNPHHRLQKSEEWKGLQSALQQAKKARRPTNEEMASFEAALGNKVLNWQEILVQSDSLKGNAGWPRMRQKLRLICTCGKEVEKLMTSELLASSARAICKACSNRIVILNRPPAQKATTLTLERRAGTINEERRNPGTKENDLARGEIEARLGAKVENWDSLVFTRYGNPSTKTENGRQALVFTCRECGQRTDFTFTSISEVPNHCASCSACHAMEKRPKRSKGELEVQEYLESLGEKVVSTAYGVAPGFEVDIYLPKHDLGIEYNGLYWHNEDRKGSSYHLDKLAAAEKNGKRLIQIFEDEWLLNREAVKHRLAHIVGKSPKLTGARNCTIEDGTTGQARTLLLGYHLQGPCPHQVAKVAMFEGKAVAAMTFSRPRTFVGGGNELEWELVRFVSAGNIPGIASRLLKAFRSDNPGEVIFSYADRRWSSGKLYETLGFKKTNESQPNYWYVMGGKRLHRFNFAKHKLVEQGFDASKTEKEIMEERGISRIYDCGSLVYRLDPQTT